MPWLILILINYSGHRYATRYPDGPGAVWEGSSIGLGSPDSLRYDDCSAWQIACDSTPHTALKKAGNSEVEEEEDGREEESGGWSIKPSLESSCTIRNTRLHMFTRETWGTVESVPCFADQNRKNYTKNTSEHGFLISSILGKACFSNLLWAWGYIFKHWMINT